MKKIISCSLILAVLGSLGTMCFATEGSDVASYELSRDYNMAVELCGSLVDLRDMVKEALTDHRAAYGKHKSPFDSEWQESIRCTSQKLRQVDILSSEMLVLLHECDKHKEDNLYDNLFDAMFLADSFADLCSNVDWVNKRLRKDGSSLDIPQMRCLFDCREFDDNQFNVFLHMVDDVFDEIADIYTVLQEAAERVADDSAYNGYFESTPGLEKKLAYYYKDQFYKLRRDMDNYFGFPEISEN